MKLAPSGNYEQIEQKQLGGGPAVAWISRDVEDTHWDKFLAESTSGQFQQSTIWARTKIAEGWRPVRLVSTVNEEIVGEFQILWRSSWYGRMGYVSKGPIVSPGYPGLPEFTTELLQRLTRSDKLRGLVVQPPDLCHEMSAALNTNGFKLDMLAGVNDATLVADLKGNFDAVEQRMSKWTRKKIRQAANRGVCLREGGREDIKIFFELMLATCRRQGVAPTLANEQALLALWDAAHSARCIRLTFAEYDGKPLAGLICILFGQTASLWKKGWTSADGQLYPNEYLMHEMLEWAGSKGYHLADFCAFDREMAVAMQRGEPLTPEQESSRHMFNVRLGGSPRLLPRARVYFPNPAFRFAYRALFYKKIGQTNEN